MTICNLHFACFLINAIQCLDLGEENMQLIIYYYALCISFFKSFAFQIRVALVTVSHVSCNKNISKILKQRNSVSATKGYLFGFSYRWFHFRLVISIVTMWDWNTKTENPNFLNELLTAMSTCLSALFVIRNFLPNKYSNTALSNSYHNECHSYIILLVFLWKTILF